MSTLLTFVPIDFRWNFVDYCPINAEGNIPIRQFYFFSCFALVMFIRDKFRSVSVPHELGRKGKPKNHQKEKSSEEGESLGNVLDYLNFKFPLFWQHKHSRYICRMYYWSLETKDPEQLFMLTPTLFSHQKQKISTILEEFHFEMSKKVTNVDRSRFSALIQRYPNDEMKICGPTDVMFKPLKIIITQEKFVVLFAILQHSIELPTDSSKQVIDTLLKLVQQENLFYQFFGECLMEQLNSSGELLLFRETNTPQSKFLQQYLMFHGKPYLTSVVIPLIRKVTKKSKVYEINPILMDDISVLEERIKNLDNLATTLLDSLFESRIPAPLTVICCVIKYHIASLAQGHSDAVLNMRSLAAGFFLHFLCPILVSPKIAGLTVQLSDSTKRGMILCAKLFQMLANGNQFEVGYMKSMNPFLDRNRDRFTAFCSYVVEKGVELSPFAFSSPRPSIEFDVWWNFHYHLMQHESDVYEIIKQKAPNEAPYIRMQLMIGNEYLLELYRQYPQYWKKEGVAYSENQYREAWKDWESRWESEHLPPTKTIRTPRRSKEKRSSLELVAVPSHFPQTGKIPTSRSFVELDRHSESENIESFESGFPLSSNKATRAEFPVHNDEIENSDFFHDFLVPDSPSSTPNQMQKKKRSWGFAKKRTRTEPPGKYNASSFDCVTFNPLRNGAILDDNVECRTILVAQKQLQGSEIKKTEKNFKDKLRSIARQTSTEPFFVQYDSMVQVHITFLISQQKSSLYQKINSSVLYWHSSYGAQMLPDMADVFPGAYQSMADARDAVMADLESKYSSCLSDFPQLYACFQKGVDHALYENIHQNLMSLYNQKYRRQNQAITSAYASGDSSLLLDDIARAFIPKTEEAYQLAIEKLKELKTLPSPTEKQICIQTIIRLVYLILFQNLSVPASDKTSLELICFNFGANELICILAFLLSAARIPNVYSEMRMIQDSGAPFIDKDMKYYFFIFQTAVLLLEASHETEKSLLEVFSACRIN